MVPWTIDGVKKITVSPLVANAVVNPELATKKKPSKSLLSIIIFVWQSFAQETSLHGIKFISDGCHHVIERLFWFITTSGSWAFGIYMIHLVWEKWTESPILVSFDDEAIPIWTIPFPAVTICNMNKVLKSEANLLKEKLAKYPKNQTFIEEHLLLQEICVSHGDFSHDSSGHTGEENVDISLGEGKFQQYLHELSHSCGEMFLRCHFGGFKRDCASLFSSVITDDGKCCSFNIMPNSLLFREESTVFITGMTDIKDWENWDPQYGYKNLPSHERKERPMRTVSPGLSMGLSIMLDVQSHEYFCSGFESVGFKILLHTPITHPELLEYGFAVSPGTENFIAIDPQVIFANEDIHTIPYSKRQCYLQEEKRLSFYKHYSYINCFLECISNHTFKSCGCVAYYMPRKDSTPICSPEKVGCMEKAKIRVEETGFENVHEGSGIEKTLQCQCLPSCSETQYPHENSISRMSKAKMLHVSPKIKQKKPEYSNDTYVENNISIMHIYFKHLHFIRQERGQLYGPIEFIANVGGILGLCAGLSMLSLVEVLYFFGIKLVQKIIEL